MICPGHGGTPCPPIARCASEACAPHCVHLCAGGTPDPLQLVREDLLGPKHLDVSTSKPLQQLAGMRGLESVKASVATLLGLISTNAELEEAERPVKDVCLNRVFLGNPGTGARPSRLRRLMPLGSMMAAVPALPSA